MAYATDYMAIMNANPVGSAAYIEAEKKRNAKIAAMNEAGSNTGNYTATQNGQPIQNTASPGVSVAGMSLADYTAFVNNPANANKILQGGYFVDKPVATPKPIVTTANQAGIGAGSAGIAAATGTNPTPSTWQTRTLSTKPVSQMSAEEYSDWVMRYPGRIIVNDYFVDKPAPGGNTNGGVTGIPQSAINNAMGASGSQGMIQSGEIKTNAVNASNATNGGVPTGNIGNAKIDANNEARTNMDYTGAIPSGVNSFATGTNPISTPTPTAMNTNSTQIADLITAITNSINAPQQQVNIPEYKSPYSTQLSDIFTAIQNKINTPTVAANVPAYNSPYGDQLQTIMTAIQNQTNNPSVYDPNTDAGLKVAQQNAMNTVEKESARRNMLYDSNTPFQMQQASQQLIPQYQQMYQQGQKDKTASQIAMMSAMQGLEGNAYDQYQNQIANQAQYGGTYGGQPTMQAKQQDLANQLAMLNSIQGLDDATYTKYQNAILNQAEYGGTYGGQQTTEARQKNLANQIAALSAINGLTQQQTENNAQYGGTYNGNETVAAKQVKATIANTEANTRNTNSQILGVDPVTGKPTMEARVTDATMTGDYIDSSGVKFRTLDGKSYDLKASSQALENELKKSATTGYFNPYYNVQVSSKVTPYANDYQAEIDRRMKIDKNDPLITELQAARTQKIFNNPELLAQYGDAFRTMQGEELDFSKLVQRWEMEFKQKQLTHQQAMDKIEMEYKAKQDSIQNGFESERIKIQRANQALAERQANIEAERFAVEKTLKSSANSKDVELGNQLEGLQGMSVQEVKDAINANMPSYVALLGTDGVEKLWNISLGNAISIGQAEPWGAGKEGFSLKQKADTELYKTQKMSDIEAKKNLDLLNAAKKKK